MRRALEKKLPKTKKKTLFGLNVKQLMLANRAMETTTLYNDQEIVLFKIRLIVIVAILPDSKIMPDISQNSFRF
ncbi:hypothetical protein JCM15579A_29120 [Marinifilum fragile]